MNRTAFKIATSTIMVAMTMTSVAAPSGAMRRGDPVRANSPGDREARGFYDQASRALQQGNLPQAVALMERAVSASPRDVGFRLLLADAYLRSGRFDSARATYAEAVELDPSNVRGALSVALIQIAQGRNAAAIGILDNIADRAPAADVGLAYALAGQPERAVEILEAAARSPMATPRTRQNLALAYAVAGDWRRARAIAGQDIPASEIDARMAQWAQTARPGTALQQVASLLGVSPGQDQGRPMQVALGATEPVVPGGDRVEVAQAPAPSRAQFAPAAAPAAEVALAANEAGPAEAPAFWAPPENYQQEAIAEGVVSDTPAPRVIRNRPHAVQVRYDALAASAEQPADDAVQAAPAVQAFDAPAFAPAPTPRHIVVQPRVPVAATTPRRAAFIRAAATSPLPRSVLMRESQAAVRPGNAPVVVQLGAFSNEANAERAWNQASARYDLTGRRPLTTTFSHEGRTLHRVSVSGFASAADAQRLCGQIRGQGGFCFVRAAAGDASIRWAARYANPRQRNV
jgi:Flp pilus assembly protein TadD